MNNASCGAILKARLAELKSKDPKMSLRKFARMLDIPVSILCQAINGSRKLSVMNALRISRSLGFDESLHDQFMAAALRGDVRISKNVLRDNLPCTSLPKGTWIHHAIAELSFLPNASMEPNWLSARLNITSSEARDALEDLKKQGVPFGNGGARQPPQIIVNTDLRESKIFHSELLAKAKQNLKRTSAGWQDTSALIFSVKKSKIRYARKKIREFQVSMMELLDSASDEKDEVYALHVNLFPLTSNGGARRTKQGDTDTSE